MPSVLHFNFCACAADVEPNAIIAADASFFPTPTTPTCFALPARALEKADEPALPLNSHSSIIACTTPPVLASNAFNASHEMTPLSASTASSPTPHTSKSTSASALAVPVADTVTASVASDRAGT